MGPVLFLLIFVAVTAFVAVRQRAKRTGEQDEHRRVLEAVAPLINGTVSRDGVLTGRYQDYAVSAETGLSTPPGISSGVAGSGAKTLRVHISGPSLMSGRAWQFRNTGNRWRYLEPGEEFPFGRALSRAGGIPMPDPGLEDRLRAAGIEAALERLPSSSTGWLPEVAFAGAMGANLRERYERAGRALPPEAEEEIASVGGLRIEIERVHFDDPSADQFRQLLDAVQGIIEVNRAANP